MGASETAKGDPREAASLFDHHGVGRVLFTLAALIVYRFGSLWPAPGVDPDALLHLDASDLSRIARASSSIFALGVIPVFSVMLLAELAKRAFPTLRLLAEQRPQSRTLFNRIVIIAGLLLAVFQAYGIANGLQAIGGQGDGRSWLVPEPGPGFTFGFITTQVAGTAFLVWLADQITRHGIGSGFWILLLATEISTFGYLPAELGESVRIGRLASPAIFLVAGFVIAAVAALVALERARRDGERLQALSPWPLYIATSVAGLFIFGFTQLGILDSTAAVMQSYPARAVQLITIFLLAYLWAQPNARPLTPIFTLIYGVIFLGLAYAARLAQVPLPQGAAFVAIVLTALSVLPARLAPFLPDTPQPHLPED